MSWRGLTDWAKSREVALRAADRLGRSRGRLRTLEGWRPPMAASRVPDLGGWENHDLAAAWIGHATVLMRVGGMTLLTDPVFSSRVGLGLGLFTGGPKRLVAPAVTLGALPKIDLLLISHAHFDHLDRPTLHRLPKDVPVVTAHHTRDLLDDLGFRSVRELRWGESAEVGPLRVTAREVRHWGARTFLDQHRGFNAYLIESSTGKVLYGGDTAYHEGFMDIRGVDLAVLGIGAYDPYIAAHATPEQAKTMADHCRAERILPMHHSTFRLSHERAEEPLERMREVAGQGGRLVAEEVGGVWVR